ncbi:MAG: hypothetical protein U5N86_12060 [Planctomycetota bacterium]|nr:hypothetical protein [Planctomycetota bacterium]
MGKQQMEFIPTVQAGEPIHYCEDGTPVSLVGNAEIYICLSPSIEMDFSGAELAKRMNEATVQPMGMPRGGPAVENDFGAVCYSPEALGSSKGGRLLPRFCMTALSGA